VSMLYLHNENTSTTTCIGPETIYKPTLENTSLQLQHLTRCAYCQGAHCTAELAEIAKEITILSRVHHASMEQDHETVKEIEAVGRWVMDGCADGDARLRQVLHHSDDLHQQGCHYMGQSSPDGRQ